MKGFRVLLLLALSVGAMSVFVPGASGDDGDDDDEGSSSGPIGDFAIGSGTANFGVFGESQFDFEAVSGPNGENATGFAAATIASGVPITGGVLVTGPVTCLSVVGNRAAFEVDSNVPFDVVFFVGDFGPAGMGDEYNFDPLPSGADAFCPAPGPRDQSVETGDIVVGDNQPLPGGGGDDDDDGDDDN
jgi:hypothetical protein